MQHRFRTTALRLARLLIAGALLLSMFSSIRSSEAEAPGPELVKDIQAMNGSSFPTYVTPTSDAFYFIADDGLHDEEIWRSQGTPQTTVRMAAIAPALQGIYPLGIFPLDSTRVIFHALDSSDKRQLWVTNGTAEGTQVLAQLSSSYDPDWRCTSFAGQAYFLEMAGTYNRYRLWRTDGTPTGTVQIAGPLVIPYLGMAVLDGWLYYAAEGPQGIELYRLSSGATEPELFKDMCLGDCGSGDGNASPSGMTPAAERLYFVASDDVHGKALWYTTGNAESISLVADFISGPGSYPESYGSLHPVGDGLYFAANDGVIGTELYYTTGTPETTRLVADMNPGPGDTEFYPLQSLGSTLFFYARPVWPVGQTGFYKTNGSGVEQVFSAPSYLGSIVRLGSGLYGIGSDNSGEALYRITENAAPQRVASVKRNPVLNYQNMIAWNGRLFYSSGDPVHGYEPWTSDGSEAGTRMFADINSQVTARGANIESLSVVYQDSVYFSAASGLDHSMLWRTDGTAEGTQPVSSFSDYLPAIEDAAVSNGLLYFPAENRGLWRTNGTREGTIRLLPDSYPRRLMDAGGKLFFIANNQDGSGSAALWVMNKEDTAPTQVIDTEVYMELQAGTLGGDYLFTTGTNSWKLWRSDGTTENTRAIYSGSSNWTYSQDYNINYLDAMLPFDGRLFFAAPAADGSDAFALYATDGVTTSQITAAAGMPLFPIQPLVAGDALYFGGVNQKAAGGMDTVIWKVAQGSSQAEIVYTDAQGVEQMSMDSIPLPLADLNEKLVFGVGDRKVSSVLWTTDGTPAGSKPLCPACGYTAYADQGVVVYSGKMYFSAEDNAGKQGRELWVSDGTDAGTRLLADILPGPDSSRPYSLIRLGEQLLFIASDGTAPGVGHGRELWRYDLSESYDIFLPVVVH